MNTSVKINILGLLIFLSAASMFAQSEKNNKEADTFKQIIQEFPFSTSVYLQDKTEIQQTAFGAHDESSEAIANATGYEIEYGITDWFQISAGFLYNHQLTSETSFNLNTLETGVLANIVQNKNQSLSLGADAEFLLNSPVELEDEEQKPVYSSTIIYAVEFWKMQLHLNAIAEFQDKKTNWFYNAALVYGTGNWHPVFEFNTVKEEETDYYLGTGLVLNQIGNWEFSTGARKSLNSKSWAAVLNLIYEFKLKEEG